MKFTITKDDKGFHLLDAKGERIATYANKADALAELDRRADFQEIAEESRGKRFRVTWLEGEAARDSGPYKRVIDPGASRFERLPVPLMLLVENPPWGHEGAVLCAVIDTLTREGEGTIVGEGNFDAGSEPGKEAERLCAEGILTTVSPDYGDETWDEEVIEEDADGFPTKILAHMVDALVMGATMTPFQALDSARIEIIGEGSAETETETEDEDAVAAAASVTLVREPETGIVKNPPAEWFEDPAFGANDEEDVRLYPMPGHEGKYGAPLTILDDGKVFGHAAIWGTCHIGINGQCIDPPVSQTEYAYFRTGSFPASQMANCDCDDLAIGVITMGTGHADLSADFRAAAAHYDNTGSQVADIVTGEDIHGIWVAGALRPSVTDEQRRALRASALSGDWRPIGGGLELVALLAVNVPGFPVVRTKARTASGKTQALVAAGVSPMLKLQQVRNDPVMSRLVSLESEVAAMKRITDNVRPLAASAMRDSFSSSSS